MNAFLSHLWGGGGSQGYKTRRGGGTQASRKGIRGEFSLGGFGVSRCETRDWDIQKRTKTFGAAGKTRRDAFAKERLAWRNLPAEGGWVAK